MKTCTTVLRYTCKIMSALANQIKTIEMNCHFQYQIMPINRNPTNEFPPFQSRAKMVAELSLGVVALPPEFIYVQGVSD